MLHTFILNPMFKIWWFSVVFITFVVHDGHRMPFKHPYLNQLQRLTSVCLFLINLCSVPSSFSSSNITQVPNMDICLSILRYIEMSLYILIPLLLNSSCIMYVQQELVTNVESSLLLQRLLHVDDMYVESTLHHVRSIRIGYQRCINVATSASIAR